MARRPRTDLAAPRSRRGVLLAAAGASAIAGAAGIARALAQEAPATPTGAAAGCAAPLGTPADFASVEGTAVARLTVVEIVDPFTAYTPTYPPPRGSRFVLLNVDVENTGELPLQFDPGRIFVQDAEDFVIYPAPVDLGPDPAVPRFDYQEIAPGASAQGMIGYVLLGDVVPRRAFYAPAGDRLLLLADLGRAGVAG